MRRQLARQLGIVVASSVLVLACGGIDEAGLENDVDDESFDVDEGKADSASVKATVGATSFVPEETIPVSVANGHKHSIYLPGCNQVGLQRLEGKSWQDVGPEKACFWEGLAVKVKAGTSHDTLLLPKPEGTYRVKVLYKTSCAASTPFSGCKATTRTTTSAKFTVKKDPCWGAWLDQNGTCRTPADGVYPKECCKPACPPVLCELYCPNGFEQDKNGCEICKCKAAPNDCRQNGCASGKYCTFCWTAFMCIPNGAVC